MSDKEEAFVDDVNGKNNEVLLGCCFLAQRSSGPGQDLDGQIRHASGFQKLDSTISTSLVLSLRQTPFHAESKELHVCRTRLTNIEL